MVFSNVHAVDQGVCDAHEHSARMRRPATRITRSRRSSRGRHGPLTLRHSQISFKLQPLSMLPGLESMSQRLERRIYRVLEVERKDGRTRWHFGSTFRR
jgi:hypothetical protein